MPVELHHLACDITEGGNYFLPNVYIVFQRGKKKNVKGGLMILFPSTESKRKKKSEKSIFLCGLIKLNTTTRSSTSSEMHILLFFKNYVLIKLFYLFFLIKGEKNNPENRPKLLAISKIYS